MPAGPSGEVDAARVLVRISEVEHSRDHLLVLVLLVVGVALILLFAGEGCKRLHNPFGLVVWNVLVAVVRQSMTVVDWPLEETQEFLCQEIGNLVKSKAEKYV